MEPLLSEQLNKTKQLPNINCDLKPQGRSWKWLNWLRKSITQTNLFRRSNKTHDYTGYQEGRDYFFDSIDQGTTGQMAGQGKGIQPGDYLILRHRSKDFRYRVDEIDYYSSPPDMWIALLTPVMI
ncbi:hypothetical protein BJP36_13070 [Moorena producens JHB]|uniref:Uncharacterized protein n=1 Tax=Moorena producens (strain JHB) TaxID=1454205 RepID=A0A1D9GAS9_MOOP1|nr:hypothetical protein [Moorena producens]AOY84651.2 hypothetical protein BJP36_13070 [Moorena producens JHB]